MATIDGLCHLVKCRCHLVRGEFLSPVFILLRFPRVHSHPAQLQSTITKVATVEKRPKRKTKKKRKGSSVLVPDKDEGGL